MKWVPVESSVFTAFSYIRREHVLYLKFRSGDVYRYFDFPPDRFGDLWLLNPKGDTLHITFVIVSPLSRCAGALPMIEKGLKARSVGLDADPAADLRTGHDSVAE
jgi:hypothetical protein